jgi:hypothetical protein
MLQLRSANSLRFHYPPKMNTIIAYMTSKISMEGFFVANGRCQRCRLADMVQTPNGEAESRLEPFRGQWLPLRQWVADKIALAFCE